MITPPSTTAPVVLVTCLRWVFALTCRIVAIAHEGTRSWNWSESGRQGDWYHDSQNSRKSSGQKHEGTCMTIRVSSGATNRGKISF